MLYASYQDETSIEDLDNANQNRLYLSIVLTALRKLCAKKHQVHRVNFHSIADRTESTRVRQQQENFTSEVIAELFKFFEKVKNVLVSH